VVLVIAGIGFIVGTGMATTAATDATKEDAAKK